MLDFFFWWEVLSRNEMMEFERARKSANMSWICKLKTKFDTCWTHCKSKLLMHCQHISTLYNVDGKCHKTYNVIFSR